MSAKCAEKIFVGLLLIEFPVMQGRRLGGALGARAPTRWGRGVPPWPEKQKNALLFLTAVKTRTNMISVHTPTYIGKFGNWITGCASMYMEVYSHGIRAFFRGLCTIAYEGLAPSLFEGKWYCGVPPYWMLVRKLHSHLWHELWAENPKTVSHLSKLS